MGSTEVNLILANPEEKGMVIMYGSVDRCFLSSDEGAYFVEKIRGEDIK